MPTQIEGVSYLSAGELVDELGISRQTLWRWRQEGHVPTGYRFRDRQIFFTAEEAETIRRYAFRLQPANTAAPRQLGLFERRG
ncbi:MAG: hypothetical protein LAO05_18490 [Acidobacteriia bacterium]|nr:hypothetical protein [Terriglobia bacterium]